MAEDLSPLACKRRLKIRRLALQIHDASFPSLPAEDWGRGSPYSLGAEQFYRFAVDLGFDTIQLGPQGMTQRENPSPYDATLFSRNPLNLPLARLVDRGRLKAATLQALLVSPDAELLPSPVLYDRFQTALAEIIAAADASDRDAARQFLANHETWLVPDAVYAALGREHGALWWGAWGTTPAGQRDQQLFALPGDPAAAKRLGALRQQYAAQIEDYALVQWLIELEHQALRERLAPLGLSLFADLQVGLAPRDAWSRQSLFLQDYRMGAPPSRTNPAGQPWGYSVFDPRQLGTLAEPGPALAFVQARLRKVFAECDGVRIDHPHGWVDPWVYLADDPEPFHAVQTGARLFSSPAETGHAALAPFAIARADQLDPAEPRHADQRVRELDDAQVARYALLVDAIVEEALAQGRSRQAIACEVLSTLPYPIARVLERHGLGRFRVVQKAALDNPADVYRLEQAAPADWIMLSTHDTPTIWELAQQWVASGRNQAWHTYLSSLAPTGVRVGPTATPAELVQALFSAMLASRAEHVMMFFPDLFGLTERYNQPGIVAESNWRLRLPSDFEAQYRTRCQRGEALDMERAYQQALELVK